MCIIACKRCGIHTRHEREEWIQRPLPLLLLTGRVEAGHRLALHKMWKTPVGAGEVRDRGEGIAWWSSRRDTMSKTKQPDVAFEQFEQAGWRNLLCAKGLQQFR